MPFSRPLWLISDDTGSWLKVNHKFMRQIAGVALYQQLLPHCRTGGTFLYIDASGSGSNTPAHQFLRHLQKLQVAYTLSHEPRINRSRIHSFPLLTR